MTISLVTRDHRVLASSSIPRPRCSGSSKIRSKASSSLSSTTQVSALFLALVVALVAFPTTVAAAPPLLRPDIYMELQARAENSTSQSTSNSSSSSSSSNGSISMNVWLPILLLTVVFVLFSFCACVRRCAAGDAASRTNGTTANGTASNTAGNTANAARPRRRPRRTPSQISTKSLPPYMKEPGDLELVLFRGPEEGEDDQTLPHGMPTLAEDDDEHPEMHGVTYDVALDRMETIDTMADSSTTNLIRSVSASVPRPPELHHPSHHGHRRSADARSLDSVGSDAELLAAHQRTISVDNPADPRGAAPLYTEVAPEAGMTTISLYDAQPNTAYSDATVPPSSADNVPAGGARSRFSFLLHNPFNSRHDGDAPPNAQQPSPSELSAQHTRSGSALSRFSSRESHESHHSRTQSNSNSNVSHSHSNSALCRAFRSHSPGMHPASSTISLDSISAPLTHTVKRAEFHAPKGGLLTPEQIKLITSREGLQRFGVPYGADAVAAFSRERLADMGPPPDFEAVAGEHEEQPNESGTTEGAVQPSDIPEPNLDATSPRSTSLSPASHTPSSETRTGSRASSYGTAPESDEGRAAQMVQVQASEDENEPDDPRTARPLTPTTARPLSGSVSRRV